MNNIITLLGTALLIALLVVAIAAILSLPLMFLWNWLMPLIFGLKTITWIQAWGLMLISAILFKNNSVSTK